MRRRWLAGWAVAVEMKKMGMGRVAGQQEFGRRVAKEMMEVVKMGMGRVAGNGGVFLCLVWVMKWELQVLVFERCR